MLEAAVNPRLWLRMCERRSPRRILAVSGCAQGVSGTPGNDQSLIAVHGRFSNIGLPKNWIGADIVRIAHGVLAEHWDVQQDGATSA